MFLVIRTPRPSGVGERFVDVLLDVLDHPLFELGSVLGEQANAGRSLLHNRLVAGPEGTDEIL
jgi:hypothetical protein